MSDADDVRWLAQKVVAKAFHGVSDASVEALARRVLELEQHKEALSESLQQMVDRLGDAEEHAANVRAVEREACARTIADFDAVPVSAVVRSRLALEIRRRDDLRSTPTLDDVKRGGA